MAQLLYGPYSEIWGHYSGNEAALLSELPIFSSNEKFYCAMNPNWFFDYEKQENVLDITNDELEYFIPYNPISKKSIEIKSGQMVVQAGPKYLESLDKLLAGSNFHSPIGEEWIEVQDGFKICCKPLSKIESIIKEIGEYAIKEFDSELKAANGKYVSQKAMAAIEIFAVNYLVEAKQRFYRIATDKLASNNTERYILILRLSSIEFDEPVEVLDKLVHEFYETKYCK